MTKMGCLGVLEHIWFSWAGNQRSDPLPLLSLSYSLSLSLRMSQLLWGPHFCRWTLLHFVQQTIKRFGIRDPDTERQLADPQLLICNRCQTKSTHAEAVSQSPLVCFLIHNELRIHGQKHTRRSRKPWKNNIKLPWELQILAGRKKDLVSLKGNINTAHITTAQSGSIMKVMYSMFWLWSPAHWIWDETVTMRCKAV